MALLIDSHCHLTFDGLCERIDTVLERAASAGVGECVTIATDLADAQRALAMSQDHACVHVVAGIHPHESSKVQTGWDEALSQITKRDDVYAVGEMGLDYHYDFSDREDQARVFRRQLEIATDVGKPIVIHCREAHADALAILSEFPRLAGVVFHCFTGTKAEAAEILEPLDAAVRLEYVVVETVAVCGDKVQIPVAIDVGR